MNIGRNDPCPCGSGKKYKKCCLDKDQNEARAAAKPREVPRLFTEAPPPAKPVIPPHPEMPLDPLMESINARWDEFEALEDFDAQIALFQRTLDEEELMDDQMAFDMLLHLYEQGVTLGHDGRFLPLLEALRERLPEAYAKNAAYFLEWRINHALATGEIGTAEALADELTASAAQDIDTFNKIADQLAYRGQVSLLARVLRAAWPAVKDSREIVSWGIDEFALKAAKYEIFDALEQGLPPESIEGEWLARVEVYQAIEPDAVARLLGQIRGAARTSWTPEDFDFLARRSREADPGKEKLYGLGLEFLGYLRREEGVPYSKGELARERLHEYLLQRRMGQLDAQQPAAKGKRTAPQPVVASGLCPDPDTLDRYFGSLLGFIFPQRYKAAAFLELLPPWLRFLEARGLIGAEQREAAMAGPRAVAANLLVVWEGYQADPALVAGLRNSGLLPIQPC